MNVSRRFKNLTSISRPFLRKQRDKSKKYFYSKLFFAKNFLSCLLYLTTAFTAFSHPICFLVSKTIDLIGTPPPPNKIEVKIRLRKFKRKIIKRNSKKKKIESENASESSNLGFFFFFLISTAIDDLPFFFC